MAPSTYPFMLARVAFHQSRSHSEAESLQGLTLSKSAFAFFLPVESPNRCKFAASALMPTLSGSSSATCHIEPMFFSPNLLNSTIHSRTTFLLSSVVFLRFFAKNDTLIIFYFLFLFLY